jgi:hypothetical protein
MPRMSTDDRDDPGADTAMFRAYVERPEADVAPATNRILVIAIAVAVVALVLLGLLALAA